MEMAFGGGLGSGVISDKPLELAWEYFILFAL